MMWVYLDFFLQVFVHALAWTMALAIVAGLGWGLVLRVLDYREWRRVEKARAWLDERLGK